MKKKAYEVNIPENTLYVIFQDQDTIRLNVVSYNEEQDSLFPMIHTAVIGAQSDSQFMRLNFPISGAAETLFFGEFFEGDTLQPNAVFFGIGTGSVVENSNQKLKALFLDSEFLNYYSSGNKLGDVYVYVVK